MKKSTHCWVFPNCGAAKLQMHQNTKLVCCNFLWFWDRKLNFLGHFSGNACVAHPKCNIPIPGCASFSQQPDLDLDTGGWQISRNRKNPPKSHLGRQLGQAGTYKSRVTPSFPNLLHFSSCLHLPPLPKPSRNTPRLLLQLHSCSLPKSLSFPPLLPIFPFNHSFLSPSSSISFLPWNLNFFLFCCKDMHKSKKTPTSLSLGPNPCQSAAN